MPDIRIFRADGTQYLANLPVDPTPFRMDAENLNPIFESSLMHRTDAAPTMFLARALEEIDPMMYARQYARLEAGELVQPRSMNPGANKHTYRQTDGKGAAVVTTDYNVEHPIVEVSKEEFSQGVVGILSGYRYNLQELRAALYAGESLDTDRALVARRVIAETTNRIGLLGYPEFGITGLFNQAYAQAYTLPADGNQNGGSSSTRFIHKTTRQIERDIQGILNMVPETTAEIEKATRVLMPYATLRFLEQTRIADDVETKILDVIKGAFPGVEFRGALFLESAGAGGSGRLVAYNPSREIVEWLVPIAFEQFAPFQPTSTTWQIIMHARIGGIVNRRPLCMIYADHV
jgi:hypothetical protein